MNGGPTPTLAVRTRAARYVAALAIVLAAAGSVLTGATRVCRDALPAQGAAAIAVCGPPAVTDTATVAVLAVILMLLAPDLGEAGVAGVTVKRAVEEAKADAAVARADVAAVRLNVLDLHQQAAASASGTASATAIVQTGEAAVLTTLADLGLLRGVPATATGGPVAVPATPSPPRVTATAQALLLSESLERARMFLRDEWRDGTLIGIVGDLTLLAGARLPPDDVERILTAPAGVVARAKAGDYASSSSARVRRAVAAAPVRADSGAQVGVIVAVAPRGVVLDGSEVVDLAAAGAVFAPAAAAVRSTHTDTARFPGPNAPKEAP